jgi:dTDP-4-dehydrorhamnose reductase
MKILILGSTGMLGSEIFKVFSNVKKYDLFTSSRTKMRESKNHIEIDLVNEDYLKKIQKIDPDLVIYCTGNTSVSECELNPDMAKKLHIDVPGQISRVCKKIIYISTDSVFSGEHPPYTEESLTSPINFYAQSKSEGEKEIKKKSSDYMIIRTNMYGIGSSRGESLVEWAVSNMSLGNKIDGFADLFFNPLSVNQISYAIKFLIEKDFTGTINVAGDYSISKYEFLSILATSLEYNSDLVIRSISSDFFSVPRPKNTTLSIKNIKQLGFNNLKLEQGMKYIAMKIREV